MAKYADCPTTEAEVSIDAPPSAVWPLLIDINTPAAFSKEFQGADWVEQASEDGPTMGDRFRGRNKHKVVGEWSATCEVSDLAPEAVFEWIVFGGQPPQKAARWRYDLSADGEGSTLRFSAQIGPGPSGLTPAIEAMPEREEDIVDRRLVEWNGNMVRTITGIKALAEGRDPEERIGQSEGKK